MKKLLANLFYFAGALAWTYGFQWILVLWVGSVRFTAAGAPPGDIGIGSKLIYSIGVPLFHFFFLTILFLLYRFILNEFSIELKKVVPIIFNAMITLYIMWRLVYVVFDYHL
ncbi:hypothetical protein [Sporosarcina sp. HYO08]|uniref:hypothetical protein n=1 Tax=Sporosarcina sp. HYO08 TaxID=1759557 RepID=UPI0007956A7E|nr:hypothetical protein [Sporosarcina sp. HYO08]KXH87474.1 hypothetical protein AU377_02590 [Sporosarcina sp. HYO08]